MDLVLVAVGSNLPNRAGMPPLAVCQDAIARVGRFMPVRAVSRWYASAPVPAAEQPDYVNGVIALEGEVAPEMILKHLHGIESELGRERSVANAARVLDLDLLAVGAAVRRGPGLVLPHGRLHERAFVLLPLCDVAPEWRHPVLHARADALLARLSPDLLSTVRAIT